jgi:hypothetical protein
MESDIFQSHGHYLFRDRRTSPSKTTEGYISELKRIWAQLHPDRPQNFSLTLANSPPFSGWSHDYGESAVVLMDKGRNANALDILEQITGRNSFADLKTYVHGDKESYWQAVALADCKLGMNPYIWAAVGSKSGSGEACCHQYTLAQWLWQPGHHPEIFYLNGDGIEKLLSQGDDALFHSWVSHPLDYFSSQTNADTYCNPGAIPIPTRVSQTLMAYRLLYESFALIGDITMDIVGK